MKQIPNLFTLTNLLFGCLAIVAVLQNGIIIHVTAEGSELLDIPEKIWLASLFIGIAAVVDFLDGFVARLFKATSEMGKQLDSLADVVSFGVAPGMIIYQFLRLSFAKDPSGVDTSLLWLVPAFILPCAAAWRLARFNLDTTQTYHFKGMPVPAVGLLVASLPMIYFYSSEQWMIDLLLNKWFLFGIIFFLAYFMVSNHKMISLKFSGKSFNENEAKYILVLFSLLLIIFQIQNEVYFKIILFSFWLVIPIIFLFYIVLSFCSKYLESTFYRHEGKYAISAAMTLLFFDLLWLNFFRIKHHFIGTQFQYVLQIVIAIVSILLLRVVFGYWVMKMLKRKNAESQHWPIFAFIIPSLILVILGLKYWSKSKKEV